VKSTRTWVGGVGTALGLSDKKRGKNRTGRKLGGDRPGVAFGNLGGSKKVAPGREAQTEGRRDLKEKNRLGE